MENCTSNRFSEYRRMLNLNSKKYSIEITLKSNDDNSDHFDPHLRSINLQLNMLLKQREFLINEKLIGDESNQAIEMIDYIENNILKLINFKSE